MEKNQESAMLCLKGEISTWLQLIVLNMCGHKSQALLDLPVYSREA
jgi:hypothetical protein